MPKDPGDRKPRRLRVNFPLSIPLDEARVVIRAYELLGESRNAFVLRAAVERAHQVLSDAGQPVDEPAAATAA